MRSKSFEPWPSLHVAHTYSPPTPHPSPPPRRARQERPRLLMLFCRHLVCRLLQLALYGAGSCRAGRGRDLHTASPGLSSAGVLPVSGTSASD